MNFIVRTILIYSAYTTGLIAHLRTSQSTPNTTFYRYNLYWSVHSLWDVDVEHLACKINCVILFIEVCHRIHLALKRAIHFRIVFIDYYKQPQ